jgi:hypothetical protein
MSFRFEKYKLFTSSLKNVPTCSYDIKYLKIN